MLKLRRDLLLLEDKMGALKTMMSGCVALVAATAIAGSAWAGVGGSFNFTWKGDCADCGLIADASATLNVQGYELGSELNASNFAGFTYHSDKLGTLTATSLIFLAGSFPTTDPAHDRVEIIFNSSAGSFQFDTFTGGDWNIGPFNQSADRGLTSLWNGPLVTTDAPEPATLALLGAGLLGLGVARRRRA